MGYNIVERDEKIQILKLNENKKNMEAKVLGETYLISFKKNGHGIKEWVEVIVKN